MQCVAGFRSASSVVQNRRPLQIERTIACSFRQKRAGCAHSPPQRQLTTCKRSMSACASQATGQAPTLPPVRDVEQLEIEQQWITEMIQARLASTCLPFIYAAAAPAVIVHSTATVAGNCCHPISSCKIRCCTNFKDVYSQ